MGADDVAYLILEMFYFMTHNHYREFHSLINIISNLYILLRNLLVKVLMLIDIILMKFGAVLVPNKMLKYKIKSVNALTPVVSRELDSNILLDGGVSVRDWLGES